MHNEYCAMTNDTSTVALAACSAAVRMFLGVLSVLA
jgi:hypothetical protein